MTQAALELLVAWNRMRCRPPLVPSSSSAVALFLSADLRLIEGILSELNPAVVYLGASADLLTPSAVQRLRERCGALTVMRSIPVTGPESVAVARSYDGIADMLLPDSHRPGDAQIGALGLTTAGRSTERSLRARAPR